MPSNRSSVEPGIPESKRTTFPDYWDYSLAGLAAICKDGKDCIRSTINEIEAHSYIKKNGRMRNDLGQLCDTEYTIYEKPMLDLSTLENSTQLSNKKLNKQVSNTDLSSINQSNSDVMAAMEIYKQVIFNNIEYDIISEQYSTTISMGRTNRPPFFFGDMGYNIEKVGQTDKFEFNGGV